MMTGDNIQTACVSLDNLVIAELDGQVANLKPEQWDVLRSLVPQVALNRRVRDTVLNQLRRKLGEAWADVAPDIKPIKRLMHDAKALTGDLEETLERGGPAALSIAQIQTLWTSPAAIQGLTTLAIDWIVADNPIWNKIIEEMPLDNDSTPVRSSKEIWAAIASRISASFWSSARQALSRGPGVVLDVFIKGGNVLVQSVDCLRSGRPKMQIAGIMGAGSALDASAPAPTLTLLGQTGTDLEGVSFELTADSLRVHGPVKHELGELVLLAATPTGLVVRKPTIRNDDRVFALAPTMASIWIGHEMRLGHCFIDLLKDSILAEQALEVLQQLAPVYLEAVTNDRSDEFLCQAAKAWLARRKP